MISALIVEDDEVLLKVYKTKFETSGFTVDTASNGKEGLDKALKHHPDIVILDLAMPQMDGVEMMKHVRADSWGAEVPIVILTNLDPTDRIVKAVIEHKAAYYLIKANTTSDNVVDKAKELLSKGSGKV